MWGKGSILGMESRRVEQGSRTSGPSSKIGHGPSQSQLPPQPGPGLQPRPGHQGLLLYPTVLPAGAGCVQGKDHFPRLLSAPGQGDTGHTISAEAAGSGMGIWQVAHSPLLSPLLKLQNTRTHLGVWVPCLPAWLLFSQELVPPYHPLTVPLHKKATKPRGEHIYLIWGWGYCCLCQCVWVVGRQPEGLLPWSKRLFWPQAGIGSRLRGGGRCVKGEGEALHTSSEPQSRPTQSPKQEPNK